MINRIIHQIVGPTKNDLIQRCLNSWAPLKAKGFIVKVWNDELINEFIEDFYPYASEAISKARNHAEAADIARYLIVYHYGGYYVDWDVELLIIGKFIKITNKYKNGFLILDPSNATIASECFSSISGDRFLKYLADEIVEIFNSKKRNEMGTPQFSGPYRMRDAAFKYKLNKQELKQEFIEINNIFLYNYKEIRSMPERKRNVPLIHYWVHSWI